MTGDRVRGLALWVLPVLAYLAFLDNPLVFEDAALTTRRATSRDLSSLPKLFAPREFPALSLKNFGSVYRPLLEASYVLDQQVWGARRLPRRAENLLLHLLVTQAVFRLARLFVPVGAAFWAALLFALHPANGEVIFTVTYRGTQMAAALGLWAAVLWLGRPAPPLWGVLALYAASIMVKEIAFPIPAMMVLGDFVLGGREQVRARRWAYLPLAAVAVGYLLARPHLIPATGGLEAPASLPALAAAAKVALYTLGETVRLAVWPVSLAIVYPVPASPAFWDPVMRVGMGTAAAGAVALAFAWGRWPAVAWGLGAAALMHLPTANVVRPAQYPLMVTERNLYLVLAGLAVAFAGVLARLRSAEGGGWWPIARAVAVVLVCGSAALTAARGLVWRDGSVIARGYRQMLPGDSRAHYAVAYEMHRAGRYAEAADLYREALRYPPPLGEAWMNLGLCEKILGRRREAEEDFQRAAAMLPADPRPFFNLGNLRAAGGRRQAAAAAYRAALRRRPDFAEAHRALGNLAVKAGRLREAQQHFADFERARAGAP